MRGSRLAGITYNSGFPSSVETNAIDRPSGESRGNEHVPKLTVSRSPCRRPRRTLQRSSSQTKTIRSCATDG